MRISMSKIEELRAQVNELHDQIRAIQNEEYSEKRAAALGKVFKDRDRESSIELTYYTGLKDDCINGVRITRWDLEGDPSYFIENVSHGYMDEEVDEVSIEQFYVLRAEAKAALGL
jgi:hypothetical protein